MVQVDVEEGVEGDVVGTGEIVGDDNLAAAIAKIGLDAVSGLEGSSKGEGRISFVAAQPPASMRENFQSPALRGRYRGAVNPMG